MRSSSSHERSELRPRHFALRTGAFSLLAMVALACGDQARERASDTGYEPPPVDSTSLESRSCTYPETGDLARSVSPPAGWATVGLDEARAYWDSLESAALVVLHRGIPVAVWGTPTERYLVQSVRKSLLNALFGVGVRLDAIDLGSSLADLGIDDSPPLTAWEKKATVEDLLLARSGVYHSALYAASDGRPERGSHPPGTHWFYNNWDFNALATVFERATGRTIHGAFDDWVAQPIGMVEYRPRDVAYVTRRSLAEWAQGNRSNHPAYLFSMSTRDLARFGLLYLCEGRWKNRQVLPASWIERTMDGEPTGEGYDYGYLWRIDPAEEKTLFDDVGIPGEIWIASGSRGHLIVIAPALDLVVAHQVATRGAGSWSQLRRLVLGSPRVRWVEFEKLLGLLVQAHPATTAPD